MRPFTRREAIGTLVSVPGLCFVDSLRFLPAILSDTVVPPPIATLNVVLHGLFAFVVWKSSSSKYIQAIAPVVSNHSYYAGGKSFASLKTLNQGQAYSLTGVNDGNLSPGFDPSKNSVFGNIHQIDYRISYCQILLPFPDSVRLLRVVPMQAGYDFYQTAPTLIQKPTSLPLIYVFTYTLSDTNLPKLDPLTPVNFDVSGSSYNLHLRAEPRADIPGGPVGFASLNLLFPELHAQLNPHYDSYYAAPDNSFPSGLSVLDECTLEELISDNCPPPSTMPAMDSRAKKPVFPLDGHLVNCQSVVLPQ